MSPSAHHTAAALLVTPGDPPRFEVESVPVPGPGPTEALVHIRLAAVSYFDALHAQGRYQVVPTEPFIPGTCAVGTVAEVGSEVDWCTTGDRVAVQRPHGGALTELAIVDRTTSTVLPPNIEEPELVSMLEAWTTMHFALTTRLTLSAGERVLVLGAAGAIGMASIDICRALGAELLGAGSSAATRERALQAGADHVVDTSTSTWTEQVRQLHPDGVDVVIDPVGGEVALAALRLLRPYGRYGVVGFASGDIPRFGANRVLIGNHSVIGIDFGDAARHQPSLRSQMLREVVAQVAAGRYRGSSPHIAPLAQAPAVFTQVHDRHTPGRWIIDLAASSTGRVHPESIRSFP